MPFYAGEKEFSDKTVAQAYRQRLAERKAWCVEQAKKFFASKQTTKRYKVDVFYPEVDDVLEIVFSDAEYQMYHDFIEKNRREFMEQECPEAIGNDEVWDKYLADDENCDYWYSWLKDAFADADFKESFINGIGYEQEADVTWVDLDHPVSVYRFNVHYFNYDDPEKITKSWRYVKLTDEQYIELVAACMEDPQFTTWQLLKCNPEMYKTIKGRCSQINHESAIFLTEAKADAEAILKEVGDQMPQMPEGPFADIAAWLASKPENQ